MSDTCIFCKIVSKDAKATIVYQDEQVTAFRDLHPVAPTHILIVPNKHIESVGRLEVEDEQVIGHIFTVARKLANDEGISEGGYRMITNTGYRNCWWAFRFSRKLHQSRARPIRSHIKSRFVSFWA